VIGSNAFKASYDVIVLEVVKNIPFSSMSLVGEEVLVTVGEEVVGARVGSDLTGDGVDLVGVFVGVIVGGGLSPGTH
jgi:hypothetical protein